MTIFANLRHWFPGMVVEHLTWPQLRGYIDRMAEMAEAKSGKKDHRGTIARMKRRAREE